MERQQTAQKPPATRVPAEFFTFSPGMEVLTSIPAKGKISPISNEYTP
jgi:hypothetical protein